MSKAEKKTPMKAKDVIEVITREVTELTESHNITGFQYTQKSDNVAVISLFTQKKPKAKTSG